MTVEAFTDGWTVRPRTSLFSELAGARAEPRPIRLPHDAMLDLERRESASAANGYYPGGAFEYTREFDVPEGYRSRRVSVRFEGAYRDAVVYVNGDFAAQRPSGYAEFTVALDPFLRYGQMNTIRVETRSHDDSRWYTGAGLYREVQIIVTDLVHVVTDGIQVVTRDIESDQAVIEVVAAIVNEGTSTQTVVASSTVLFAGQVVTSADSAPVTIRPGETVTVRRRAIVHEPALWSPQTPSLYTAALTLTRGAGEGVEEMDSVEAVFGIRRIQVDATHGLRINGESVLLRGACVHHDNGILGAAAIRRAEERRVELLKDAGFNAIRGAHNPLSRAMLDACDRLGMLVIDETFDMWAHGKSAFDYALSFPEWWERDVEAMVAKDINHPSVIFYSIGNEVPETGTPLGSGWGRRLAEKIRSLDDTRLVTNGINGFVSVLPQVLAKMAERGAGGGGGGVNTMMSDAGQMMNAITASPLVGAATAESFSVLDVAGMNYGDARYAVDAQEFPNRVIVGTETFPGKIAHLWGLVEQHPHVIGDFTWTGWDYLGEAGIGRIRHIAEGERPAFEAPFPALAAEAGDIDITGHRRPVSYYRETVYGARHEPYIAVQPRIPEGATRHVSQWGFTDAVSGWSWDVPAGTPLVVEVYSDAEEVELNLNGRTVGRAAAGREREFRAYFEVPYEEGTLEAIAGRGDETFATALHTAVGPLRLRLASDKVEISSGDSDLAHIAVELVDADGNLAHCADRSVTVDVDGPGYLQALGSARPDQTERFDRAHHQTYQGRVLAIVRPDRVAGGTITVRAHAEEVQTASIQIAVS